jgi:Cu(I)/Ag(I) efflux system membrane protein CusA/SilA
MGFNTVFGFVSSSFQKVNVSIENTIVWSSLSESFPGIGKEFMPSLDEGSFLLMPTSMPHAGIEKNKRVVQQLDMILANIPEVELAVGKMGRTESALDPAPISMYENIINYKSEYALNEQGHRQRFKTDNEDLFVLTNGDTISNADAITQGITRDDLISDDNGQYFRNWRDHIQSSDDIWNEIIGTINLPGVTSAPKLQPIETRLVMLQTGMRAPMGIKVFGPDLPTIEKFGMELEQVLKEVPSVKTEAVFADRIVGKPYIHLNINREAISRYGLSVVDVQQTIETAIGGMQITTTVEGRERFPVRVRYPRELRDDPSSLNKIVVSTASGAHIPLGDLVDVEYVRGPQMIKSENTFLVGYVLLDKKDGFAEVDVVEAAQNLINERIDEGSIVVPKGVSYKFSGSYENQIRAEKRLAIVVPLVLVIIFLILYFQFKSISTSLMIFGGIAMAFSGAFLMLWFYSKGWFLNFSIFDTDLRDLFQIKTINLSVAVWVGFIALFGIATDDGVLIGTYLDHSFKKNKPNTVGEIRAAVSEAGLKRIKPAIMTTATTIIALLPVLTSTGRGADIMIPMAIPAFGGMIVASITYFITPVLYSMREEYNLKRNQNEK